MTDGMKLIIVLTVCFIAVGTAFTVWSNMTPPKTAAQIREDTYSVCVGRASANHWEMTYCNDIKQ